MTFHIGDRVRALANDNGIPEGAKGHIVSEEYQGLLQVDFKKDGVHATELINVEEIEHVGDPEPEQPVEAQASLDVQAGHDEVTRTKLLMGAPFVGTNLPEEMLEIKFHMRQLIDAGYTYFFIERYLKGMNYPTDLIRRSFKKITGLTPQEAVNINAIYTPGTIPQFNLGWGEAKKGKNEYYFVMPIKHGYSVFCQEGDRNREEVFHCSILTEALDYTKKMVKKLEQWNPPIKETKGDVDTTQLYRQIHIFREASTDRLYQHLLSYPNTERLELVRQAYVTGLVEEHDRDALLDIFGAGSESVEQEVARTETQEMLEREMTSDGTEAGSIGSAESVQEESARSTLIKQMADGFMSSISEEFPEFNVKILNRNIKIFPFSQDDEHRGAPKSEVNPDGVVTYQFSITDSASGMTKNGKIAWPIIGDSIIDPVSNEPSRQFFVDGKSYTFSSDDLESSIRGLFAAERESIQSAPS